ncbi:MAG: NYN domain-containing protein [Nanoarchaeota archaeon]
MIDEDTLVFLDEGFIYKLSKYFGGGKSIKFDRAVFAKNLSAKQKLFCKKIFYYNAPPFQGEFPTKDEELRREGYDNFIKGLTKCKDVLIREGRCQRLKIDGKFEYKQKGVDVFLAMDLTNIPTKHPNIKKIILVSSDSDFVPVIKNLQEQGIKTILYTYYEGKNRRSIFSTSNELIKSVHKYVRLTKEDFLNSKILINKKEEMKNEK